MEVNTAMFNSSQLMDCRHKERHSEVQQVFCTVVHLDVVCDKCNQIVETLIEI